MPKAQTTKKDLIRRQLTSARGATIASLMQLTGWQEHSVRAAMSTMRKAGDTITPTRQNGKPTVYRIEAASSPAKTGSKSSGKSNNE